METILSQPQYVNSYVPVHMTCLFCFSHGALVQEWKHLKPNCVGSFLQFHISNNWSLFIFAEICFQVCEGDTDETFLPNSEVTKSENGVVSYKSDLPVKQGQGQLQVTLRRTRTPSNSAVEHKDTVMEVKRRSEGGGEYSETNSISTQRVLRHTGSVKLNTTATTTRKVELQNGQKYEETDVHKEVDEKSLSKDLHTVQLTDSKIITEAAGEEKMTVDESKGEWYIFQWMGAKEI